jgi:AhpD family alkylhydroperoxidase
MTHFPVLTMESAPERSKPALKQLEAAFGMIPNIAGVMANSPVLINSLVGLFGNVHGGSFTEPQVQTVLLTDAVTNACAWAVAFHTALGLKAGLDPADVEAIRERRLPKDMKHAALSLLAKTLIEKRGRLDDQDRSIHRRRLQQGPRSRGHRHRRRVHDHELYRKRDKNPSRSAVPGACLVRLNAPHL